MALPWSRLLITFNCSVLFFSLALVGLSPAILYLTSHGMHRMNKAWPQGYYEWYRGPSWDMDTKHKVRLVYTSSNEHMLFAAGAVCMIAGLIGVVGFFLAPKTNKPSTQRGTLLLQVLPGIASFIVTFIAFLFTQIVYDSDNRGACDWTRGYYPNNMFRCTREQAACNIVGYFTKPENTSDYQRVFDTKREICGETQTGRHLLAPLFAASVLFCGVAVGKLLVEKRESRFVESAEERVERLERQEE